jgi:GH25 family lysozyme M1 (1,4-beta-N-acetylmuramidase)
MAKRKKRKKKPILLTVVLLLLSALLLADLIAARVYMRHTEADFFTALLQTTRLGGQYVVNLLSPADQSIPVNPYSQTDYYKNGDYIQCAASEVSRTGVDVSSHQQGIDWQQVADAGVEFAIVRVGYRGFTDGDIFPDTTAEENIRGALAAGLDVGVYFFSQATSVQEAKEEAWFVLDAIDGYSITYPVMFDWESITTEARTDEVTGPEMTEFARAFCAEIENAGYDAGVYFNQSDGYNSYDLRALRSYDLWLAEYADAQSFAYEVQLWQYTNQGAVPGIGTAVDLNLCYRDYKN